MPPGRSTWLRNGTPRDALVSASLSILPRRVKRVREEMGLVGEAACEQAQNCSPSLSSSGLPVASDAWIFVPVTSASGTKVVVQDVSVKLSNVLNMTHVVSGLSSSSPVSRVSQSTTVDRVDDDAVVTVAKRHRPNGPIVPDPQRAPKGSVQQAIRVAQNPVEAGKALEVFSDALYAPQTLATKASLRNTWFTISRELGFEPLPLTPQKIFRVAAVLRASGFRSTYSYLCEVRQHHLRSGYVWTQELDLCVKDTKRAATRGLGPPAKAEEIPEDVMKEIWSNGDNVEGQGHWPALRHEVWILATSFLLREVELAGLRMGQSETHIDMKQKRVTLYLPVSKSDPMGKGCKRTLACVCSKFRNFQCPFCAAVALVRNQVSNTGVEPTDPQAAEIPLVAMINSPWETIRKEHVIEAIKADVCQVIKDRPEMADRLCCERVTGHSFRRTGAKSLAKRGTPIELIQFMARHSSNAILGYVEEAIEESPSGASRLQEQLELRELVNLALKDCKDLKESVEQVTEKLKQGSLGTSIHLDKEFVLQTFDRWARPEVIYNVITRKLHSTAGNSFRTSPKDWNTACGWKWITAGREARACLESSDLPADFTVCAKCRNRLPGWVFESDRN